MTLTALRSSISRSPMTSVELFAGIGGFRIAADACGLRTIWANDLCSMASAVYRSAFGGSEFVEGDIDSLIGTIPSHDVLTGGFPCQPFSSAGKKQGIKDPRGTLFNRIIDVVERHRPRIFVLENVKRLLTMDKGIHFATILNALARLDYDIEWRLLNATDFGLPQNRYRVFIVGVRSDLSLKDGRVPIRLAIADELAGAGNGKRSRLQDYRTWKPILRHGLKFPGWGVTKKGKFFSHEIVSFAEAIGCPRLHTMLQPPEEVDSQFDFTESTLSRLQRSEEVNRYVDGVEILSNQGGGARMGYTVFGTNGIAPCLTATPSRHYERYKVGSVYRRLTNIEYARLQGFPENHCAAVSVYNQYQLYGNAVPPLLATWVIKKAMEGGLSNDSIATADYQKELFVDA